MLPTAVVQGKQNPLHLKFPTRLKHARREKQLSGSSLSTAAGLGRSGVSALETGVRLARLSTVEKLANVLHLSPVWLAFGIEAPWKPAEAQQLRCTGLPARLKEARTAAQFSLGEVGRRLTSSAAAIHAVESGTMPTLDTVEELAKVLGVSPAWLAYGIGPQAAVRRGTRREVRAESRAT